MVSVDNDWEEKEIDRALDLANVVFGAALSAYLGVLLATSELELKSLRRHVSPPLSDIRFIERAKFGSPIGGYACRLAARGYADSCCGRRGYLKRF